MTNEDKLKNNFTLQRTYNRVGRSAKHVDTILRCNSIANNKAIGTIGAISITQWDETVIVRAPINDVGVYEVKEYKRKVDHADGETMSSER